MDTVPIPDPIPNLQGATTMASGRVNDEEGDDSDTTVRMPAARWMGLKQTLADRDAEIVRLRAALREAQLADVPPELAERIGLAKTKGLGEALDAAITIVGFAVGNLHPLTVRGWPWHKLDRLAQMGLGGELAAGVLESGVAMTWDSFAREARKWEEARAQGREQALLAEENATRAPTADSLAAYGIPVVPGVPQAGESLLKTAPIPPPPAVDVKRHCPKCNRCSWNLDRCQYLDCGYTPTTIVPSDFVPATPAGATGTTPG
jgi:hypothetical protein